jgi:hypothetical protein
VPALGSDCFETEVNESRDSEEWLFIFSDCRSDPPRWRSPAIYLLWRLELSFDPLCGLVKLLLAAGIIFREATNVGDY